jgi:hypothetical protein
MYTSPSIQIKKNFRIEKLWMQILSGDLEYEIGMLNPAPRL